MFNLVMKDNFLDCLVKISFALDDISIRLRYEEKILQAELNDAIDLNLDGAERIAHYNNWMRKAGLDYLIVDE